MVEPSRIIRAFHGAPPLRAAAHSGVQNRSGRFSEPRAYNNLTKFKKQQKKPHSFEYDTKLNIRPSDRTAHAHPCARGISASLGNRSCIALLNYIPVAMHVNRRLRTISLNSRNNKKSPTLSSGAFFVVWWSLAGSNR